MQPASTAKPYVASEVAEEAVASDEETLNANEEQKIPSSRTASQQDDTQMAEKKQRESEKFRLQEDIFALLFVSPVCSQAFLYSVFWFVFQGGVISLIAYDLLKDSDEDNFLKMPPAVHPAVSAAQVLALAVAVMTQDDVISSLALVSVGYDRNLPGLPAAATQSKWVLSNVCRFLIGLASLLISFLFAVQSETVLDIFKDFAAMAFVSEIDDAAFSLAKRGFISSALEEATRGLEDVVFEDREDTIDINPLNEAKKITSAMPVPGSSTMLAPSIPKPAFVSMTLKARLRRVLLFLLFGLMVAMWSYVYVKQKNGEYICQSLSVSFGDEYWVRSILEARSLRARTPLVSYVVVALLTNISSLFFVIDIRTHSGRGR